MPHIGGPELILILVVLFLFFGASKLPQAGQALGLGLKNFKKAMNSTEDEVDVTPPKKDAAAEKAKIEALEKKLAALKAGVSEEEAEGSATEKAKG